MSVSHLDASVASGCFLQLAKTCAKRNIFVCASGLTPRIERLFRGHDISFSTIEDEESYKARILSRSRKKQLNKEEVTADKILLFDTVQEALEFCETALIHELNIPNNSAPLSLGNRDKFRTLSSILAYILGASDDEKEILNRLEDERYHEEKDMQSGEMLFQIETHSNSFYVVMNGMVANSTADWVETNRQMQRVLSGAGLVEQCSTTLTPSGSGVFDAAFFAKHQDENKTVATLWRVGSVFGYIDYLPERPRHYRAIATQDGTRVACFTHSHLNLLQSVDPVLYGLIQRVLLHASVKDLENCTCRNA